MRRIRIEKALPGDAARLLEVFDQSFYSDYLRYGECPGYGKPEAVMLESIERYHVYKIMADELVVGAAGIQEGDGGVVVLGALCVIPPYASKGIGSRAMAFLDREFPHATRWVLETPSDKAENHSFYKKFGYRVTGKYRDGNVFVSRFQRDCL